MPLRATMSVAQERAKWCRSHAGDGVGYGIGLAVQKW